MIDLKALRSGIKAKRASLSSATIKEQSKLFLKKIQTLFKGQTPKNIAIYLAHKGELDLKPSIDWLWEQGHVLYAPILQPQDDSLIFSEYTPQIPLKQNPLGILEPETTIFFPAKHLDYVLVPLVAFDKAGHRLGMGKGYYDRTFAFRKHTNKPILIACAYDFQEVAELPAKAHDVSMDFILTSS